MARISKMLRRAVPRRSRGSATLPAIRAETLSRRATPAARERSPERSPTRHSRGDAFQTSHAGRAGAQPYPPHARKCFPDEPRRPRSPTCHSRGDAFQTSHAGRAGAQPYPSHARRRFPDEPRRPRGSAALRAPESAHQQWGGSPHRTEHWLSVVEGNCVVERRGGKQPETNCQSINKAMLNTIRPDALASLRRVSEA